MSEKRKMRIKASVLHAIESERHYQKQTWPGHWHSVGEWLLIMQKCLDDAKREWTRGDAFALQEIRQVTAVGVAAMEMCGAPPRNVKKAKREILYDAMAKYPSTRGVTRKRATQQ